MSTMRSTSEKTGNAAQDEQNFIALMPDVVIGHYRILRTLGQGGFGITYLAEDEQTGKRVVIKENLPAAFAYRHPHSYKVGPATNNVASDYEWAIERFVDEARLIARLDHPNIVKVQEAFEALGTAYYVMPWVGGQDLGKTAPAPADITEEWLSPILHTLLGALDYLHSKNVYHRDIKPNNILLQEDGRPVLIDFGAARAIVSERSATMIEAAGYTPIEQVQSGGKCGPWTDLYALGAACYRLITGERPPRSVNRMGKHDPYEPLTPRKELHKRFRPAFLKAIDKALRVWGEDRWQTAAEWRAVLPAQPSPNSATAAGAMPIIVRRASALPWGISLLLLAALGGGGWYHHQSTTELNSRLTQSEQQLTQTEEKLTSAEQEVAKQTEARRAAEQEATRQTEARQAAERKIAELESTIEALTPLAEIGRHVKNEGSRREQARLKLKEQGIEVSEYNKKMEHAYDEPELLTLLLEAGADVNTARDDGTTTLYWAAFNGCAESVRILLATPGIDINKANKDGKTPLYIAAMDNHPECVRLLLAAPGIDVNKANTNSETPLCWAAYKGNTECVRLLLAAPGIDINKRDYSGSTPLHWAECKGHAECARLIRAAGGKK